VIQKNISYLAKTIAKIALLCYTVLINFVKLVLRSTLCATSLIHVRNIMKSNHGILERKIRFSHTVNSDSPEKLGVSHCHDSYEMLFVIEGEGKYVVEGREYAMTQRSVMIAKPLEYHYVKINPDENYERYVVRFNAGDLIEGTREELSNILGGDEGCRCFYLSGDISDAILSIFERSSVGECIPDEYIPAFSRMLLAEVILLFSASSADEAKAYGGELGARVIKYLNTNINRNISLDKLAKRFLVSKYYLCRAFKAHNGISVHGYVTQKRVVQAKRLIEAGESASVAAYKVGFRNYSVFYRAFVKIYGTSPQSLCYGLEK